MGLAFKPTAARSCIWTASSTGMAKTRNTQCQKRDLALECALLCVHGPLHLGRSRTDHSPELDDPSSTHHPSQLLDRPHIVRQPDTGRFVCWLRISSRAGRPQSLLVLTADSILGPYAIVRPGLRPFGMDTGDFDLVVDPEDGKGYCYFERVHRELICADLTSDLTDVTGYYSTGRATQPADLAEVVVSDLHVVRPGHFRSITSAMASWRLGRGERGRQVAARHHLQRLQP